MPLNIVRQDITKMNTDAIVAAEGHRLASHGQVGSAIADAAGEEYQKATVRERKSFMVIISSRKNEERLNRKDKR